MFKGFCVLYRVQRGALREDSQMSESPREPQLNTKVPGSGCFPDFQFSESELGPGICLLDECLSCRPWFRGFRAQDPQLVLGVPACVSITWWPRSPPRVTHNPLPKATGDPQGIPRSLPYTTPECSTHPTPGPLGPSAPLQTLKCSVEPPSNSSNEVIALLSPPPCRFLGIS